MNRFCTASSNVAVLMSDIIHTNDHEVQFCTVSSNGVCTVRSNASLANFLAHELGEQRRGSERTAKGLRLARKSRVRRVWLDRHEVPGHCDTRPSWVLYGE